MPSSARKHLAGGFAALVAVVVRLASFGPDFSLRLIVSSDDAAYFGGAQMLVEGHVPYRGFPFVQPPGVMVIASPFALLGRWVGGDVAFALLRIAMILLAGATCWLIADLLRPHGVVAQLAGALMFATHPVFVFDGRTLFLEPFLAFAVVATFWLLDRVSDRFRGYALTGLLVGVACTIKLWAAVDVVLFMTFIGVTRGVRRALAWLSGVAIAFVALSAPFFVLAPRQMIHQVITAQLGRAGDSSVAQRFRTFDAFQGFPGRTMQPNPTVSIVVVIVVFAVATAPLIGRLAMGWGPRRWGRAPWWSLFGLVESATFVVSPIFFDHYLTWPGAALSLGIGRSVGQLDRKWSRVPLLVAIGLVSLTLSVTPNIARLIQSQPNTTRLRSLVREHHCTWFDVNAVQSFVVSSGIPYGRPCRPWPDPVGALITVSDKPMPDQVSEMIASSAFQQQMRRQLGVADSAVLCSPPAGQPWDDETRTFFVDHFEVDRNAGQTVGRCTFWVER